MALHALTGIGIIASVPQGGGVAGVFGLSSATMVVTNKKIENKLSKHQEIVTLAVAKRDTVNRATSSSFKDNKKADIEFNIIFDGLAR